MNTKTEIVKFKFKFDTTIHSIIGIKPIKDDNNLVIYGSSLNSINIKSDLLNTLTVEISNKIKNQPSSIMKHTDIANDVIFDLANSYLISYSFDGRMRFYNLKNCYFEREI
jgi:hypothetical protein